MIRLEIQQIIPAIGYEARYGKSEQELEDRCDIVLWALCKMNYDLGEPQQSVMGYIASGDRGLIPAKGFANFLGYFKKGPPPAEGVKL